MAMTNPIEKQALKEIEQVGPVEAVVMAVDMIARERVAMFACHSLNQSHPYNPADGVEYGETMLRLALEQLVRSGGDAGK